jgi:hypothetical protein
MTNEEAIKDIQDNILPVVGGKSLLMAIEALKAQGTCEDAVSRQTLQKELALYPIDDVTSEDEAGYNRAINDIQKMVLHLPSAQPERKWIPCSNPPKHHRDVLVRGIEAIGNITVYKVMQWDVDVWRPKDYAPSITWEEWSEI